MKFSGKGIKIPLIGWSEVKPRNGSEELFEGGGGKLFLCFLEVLSGFVV